jgi:hypothetical protein
VQLLAEQGFSFTSNREVVGGPARTLKEFVTLLAVVPFAALAGHARRGDFSNWIGGVFHDHALASDIRKVEQRFRLGHIHELSGTIAKLIQERYQFVGEPVPQATSAPTAQEPGSAVTARVGNG